MRKAIVAMALVMAAAEGTAWAGDSCLDTGNGIIVAKGLKAPKPGKCSIAKGAYYVSQNGAVSVTACTNSAGNATRVLWTSHSNGAVIVGSADIPYPALSGGDFEYEYSYGGGTSVSSFGLTGTVSLAPCTMSYPIP